MDKFGFSISKGRYIDWEANDRSLADHIREKEPSFKLCIGCGGCAGACTAGNFTRFSLREINILIHRGENNKSLESLRKCMLCGKCLLVCPRGVNTRNVIFLARQALQKQNDYAV